MQCGSVVCVSYDEAQGSCKLQAVFYLCKWHVKHVQFTMDSDIFLPLLSSSCPVFSSSLSYSNPSPLSSSLLCHLFVPLPCFPLSLHAPSPCVSALFHFSLILLSCRTRTRSFVPLWLPLTGMRQIPVYWQPPALTPLAPFGPWRFVCASHTHWIEYWCHGWGNSAYVSLDRMGLEGLAH